MKNLTFNRTHKNGWLSWKMAGVPGAVFIDKRMLTAEAQANPPATLEEVLANGLVEPGADVSEKAAAAQAKKLERETQRAEKAKVASEKAQARLAKLQETAAKAQERAAAAQAKAAQAQTPAAPVEQAGDVAAL